MRDEVWWAQVGLLIGMATGFAVGWTSAMAVVAPGEMPAPVVESHYFTCPPGAAAGGGKVRGMEYSFRCE